MWSHICNAECWIRMCWLVASCVSSSGAAAEISVELKRGLQSLLVYSCQIRQMVQGSRACLPGNSCSDAVSWRRSRPGQSLLVMKRPNWSWETAARPVAACWPCSEAWLQPSITDAGDCSRSKLLFVPPHANASIAAASLPLLQAGPHGLQIIPLDFNQTCLKTLPPQCGQCFQASTRGINTLDCVYLEGNLLPHQGLSNISHC